MNSEYFVQKVSFDLRKNNKVFIYGIPIKEVFAMTTYNFATLDPRRIPLAEENNAKVLGDNTLGIEVTIPTLAEKCGLGNIDPQHTGGDADVTAIEMALTVDLPGEGANLVTIRADLDSVGAMAILALRAEGVFAQRLSDHDAWHKAYSGEYDDCPYMNMGQNGIYVSERQRVEMVATADKFARGGYTGPKALPTRDNPWPEDSASAEASRPLAAIASAVSDFKVPMAERVSMMETWLLTGEEPQQYRERVEKERMDMITALEDGTIEYATRANGQIAVVISTHPAATTVGYSLAPVVVALNPSFKRGPEDPYKKFTVCAFEAKFADIQGALGELADLEEGWGGSPVIGGSPQGMSSKLTIDQVVEVVEKYLK